MNKPIVKIKLLPGGKMPEKKSSGAAAWDCFAREDVIVREAPVLVGLGFMAEPPEGYYLEIVPRSSIGLKTPLRQPNSVGIIDADYRGEVKAMYEVPVGLRDFSIGVQISVREFVIQSGDRIAQMILRKMEEADLVQVDELSETERGAKGFGSTGK